MYSLYYLFVNITLYRTNVLVAGFNKFTKRIPAEKYEKFVKKVLMMSSIFLNDLQFKIADAISEQKILNEKYVTSKHIRNTVSETDIMHIKMMNKKLLREVDEMTGKNNKILRRISTHIIL